MYHRNGEDDRPLSSEPHRESCTECKGRFDEELLNDHKASGTKNLCPYCLELYEQDDALQLKVDRCFEWEAKYNGHFKAYQEGALDESNFVGYGKTIQEAIENFLEIFQEKRAKESKLMDKDFCYDVTNFSWV